MTSEREYPVLKGGVLLRRMTLKEAISLDDPQVRVLINGERLQPTDVKERAQ